MRCQFSLPTQENFARINIQYRHGHEKFSIPCSSFFYIDNPFNALVTHCLIPISQVVTWASNILGPKQTFRAINKCDRSNPNALVNFKKLMTYLAFIDSVQLLVMQCRKPNKIQRHTINWRFNRTASLTEEYSALVNVVHDVASGGMHSPEGRQSIAVACNSRNTLSDDS